jgi:hypothetical protein
MVAGTLATTAVVAVLPLASMAKATEPSDPSQQDMMAFLVLSAELTGLSIQLLAPEADVKNGVPGVDPINIKDAYFSWIKGHAPASFASLLQIAKDNQQSLGNIIFKANGADETKFLARSVALLWYLGVWYEPDELKNNPNAPRHRVVAPSAYTQGLVWQIAGAHPMGYSNLQFGYWSHMPYDPNNPADPLNPPTG